MHRNLCYFSFQTFQTGAAYTLSGGGGEFTCKKPSKMRKQRRIDIGTVRAACCTSIHRLQKLKTYGRGENAL